MQHGSGAVMVIYELWTERHPMSERVSCTVADGVADVRLTRPEKRNALDRAMFRAIIEAADQVAPTVRCGWWCCRARARRSARGSTRRCSRRWPTPRASADPGARSPTRLRVDAVRARAAVDRARGAGDRRGARRRGRRRLPARARCRHPHRRARRAARRVRDQVGDRARHVRHAAAAAARRSRRGEGPHVHGAGRQR